MHRRIQVGAYTITQATTVTILKYVPDPLQARLLPNTDMSVVNLVSRARKQGGPRPQLSHWCQQDHVALRRGMGNVFRRGKMDT